MKSLPMKFGLLHLPTKRFARFDDVTRNVIHRLKRDDLSKATYCDEKEELKDNARFYEADELSIVLEIIETEYDENDFGEVDDSYGSLLISDDFSEFTPVAFIREASRFQGTGDFIADSPSVKLVINIKNDGEVFELTDVPA